MFIPTQELIFFKKEKVVFILKLTFLVKNFPFMTWKLITHTKLILKQKQKKENPAVFIPVGVLCNSQPCKNS